MAREYSSVKLNYHLLLSLAKVKLRRRWVDWLHRLPSIAAETEVGLAGDPEWLSSLILSLKKISFQPPLRSFYCPFPIESFPSGDSTNFIRLSLLHGVSLFQLLCSSLLFSELQGSISCLFSLFTAYVFVIRCHLVLISAHFIFALGG